MLLDLATLLGRRVVSVPGGMVVSCAFGFGDPPGEEGGVGSWGGGSVEDCAFGFGDPLGEEGGVGSWGGGWCQWKIIMLLDLATLLGRRVVSVPGEEGGVGGRLLCFWMLGTLVGRRLAGNDILWGEGCQRMREQGRATSLLGRRVAITVIIERLGNGGRSTSSFGGRRVWQGLLSGRSCRD